MKLYRALLPAILLSFCSISLYANAISIRDTLPAIVEKKSGTYSKNRLRVNISSLFLNNYSFTYERSLTRKISFVAGYRTMPKIILGKVTLIKRIVDLVGSEEDAIKNDIDRISLSNSAYTGELRFYTGHKPGARGFYCSLYGRYSQLTIDYPYEFYTNTKTYVIPIKTTPKMWGAGLMIGAQWLIAKRISLDWYILGGHYGSIKGDASGVVDLSELSSFDKEELKGDIENLLTVGNKQYITATVTNQGVQAKIDGPMLGFRGAGINIGIAF